ncbi:MAG: hypothetical protein IJ576_05170, partial [Synergistaceae bacterium]|nr:hypothetical protein [Synergistaceae bacterium]
LTALQFRRIIEQRAESREQRAESRELIIAQNSSLSIFIVSPFINFIILSSTVSSILFLFSISKRKKKFARRTAMACRAPGFFNY